MPLLIASKLFAPEELQGPVGVVIRDGRIHEIREQRDLMPSDGLEVIDVRPWSIAPGFVDLHTHGFAGYDVNSGTTHDMLGMARALPSTGVTAFYPTIATATPEETSRQVERVSRAAAAPTDSRAEILGMRLEGPYISKGKPGAQYAPAIRRPDPGELACLAATGPIRLVDFAPEEDDDSRLLHALVNRGIVPSIGHTLASDAQTITAIDAGAQHCAHLFNAMPPLDHRAPGAAGALLTDKRSTVELIADGIHVHPAMLRLAVAARGPHAVALVTDAMPAAGLGDCHYTFLRHEVVVAQGAARWADGTLAGSVLTLNRAVQNMVELAGASWVDAIRMATSTPARIGGVMSRKGRIGPGADADLVVLDETGSVQQTWIGGRCAFTRQGGKGAVACQRKVLS